MVGWNLSRNPSRNDVVGRRQRANHRWRFTRSISNQNGLELLSVRTVFGKWPATPAYHPLPTNMKSEVTSGRSGGWRSCLRATVKRGRSRCSNPAYWSIPLRLLASSLMSPLFLWDSASMMLFCWNFLSTFCSGSRGLRCDVRCLIEKPEIIWNPASFRLAAGWTGIPCHESCLIFSAKRHYHYRRKL